MPSRYVSMFKSIRWTDLLLCNWWTLLIVPLYDYSGGFFKCSDNVVIFCFSFHYRKFVTLIILWWLMHCLLSGRDFIILVVTDTLSVEWKGFCSNIVVYFVFFTYYRKFVTLIILWGLIHCLLSGVDFIILIWYYPTRFVLEQQQEHVMSLRLIMLMDPKQDTPLIIYLYQLYRYIYCSIQQDIPLIIYLYQIYRYVYCSI